MDQTAQDSARPSRETAEVLREGFRQIAAVRWLYRLGALAYLVVTLFAVLALARAEVPVREGTLVVAMTTLLASLLAMGALLLPFRPFQWTLVVATLATGVSAVHLFGPNPLGLALPASAALAALLWVSLWPTLCFRRLIASHKDAYILRHASLRTRQSLKGRSPEERHERLLAAMSRAARRAWVLSAAAVVAFCLTSMVGTRVMLSQRPVPVDDSLHAFERAWDRGEVSGLAPHLDPVIRDPRLMWLAGITDEHGWRTLPPLGEAELVEQENALTATYQVDGKTLEVGWALKDREWRVVGISLPCPPVEPHVQRFRQAWDSSDPEQVAAFYAGEDPSELRASLVAAAEGRGWSIYPSVESVDVSGGETGLAQAVFHLDRGKLRTHWRHGPDGRWALQRLELPKKR